MSSISKISIEPLNDVPENLASLLLEADPSKKIVNGYLARADKFVVNLNEQQIGIICLIETRPETIEIVNIAILKKQRNKGIGGQLLQFAIDWAKKQKYHIIEIGTGSTSFAQLYLYQKYGFRPIYIDRDFFIKNYSQEIIENGLVLKDMIRLRQYLV